VRVIDDSETLQSARYYLQTMAHRINAGEILPTISRQQILATWSVAVNTDVAEAILRVAEKGEDAEKSGVFGGCDLIALSTHGLTGLPLWSLGSITERVRVGTRLPLLIIRPTAMRKSLEYRCSYDPEDVTSEV
jgi:nucleotide-binding universal stress UspA family protein